VKVWLNLPVTQVDALRYTVVCVRRLGCFLQLLETETIKHRSMVVPSHVIASNYTSGRPLHGSDPMLSAIQDILRTVY
jgi:hypothetical protein